MKKMSLVLSWLFKIAAAGLTVLLIIQTYEVFTKDNRFLFFQIILIFIWGTGAGIFWIVGFVLGRTYKARNRHEAEDNESKKEVIE